MGRRTVSMEMLPAICVLAAALGLLAPALAAGSRYQQEPVLREPRQAAFRFQGCVGERLAANRDQWLLGAPRANPAMLQMLRDRDRQPRRDLLPWSGEFVGKYLTAAVLNWRISRDRALGQVIEETVADLAAAQTPEGYLGPYPREQRLLVGWDLWGHYHALVGLLLYYDTTGDERALAAARRAADLVCQTFPAGGRRVVSVGDQEMNEAIGHGLLLLYVRSGEKPYLEMARRVEQDWEQPPSGDYVRTALAGLPFSQTPKPRWESLHDLQAIAELYWITGEARYRRAFEHTWWSILEGDRHNTGGFSSGEQATGNPYHQGAIETCCTVAWIALSLDMLRLTGSSVVADEIELSTLNGGMGAQAPSGRWWTYNTPMEGERKAAFHDINFQCRPGSPELNCCSVNGPRILGMLAQWSLMEAADGLVLNYYGRGELAAALPGGEQVRLRQETAYPRQGEVTITVQPAQPRQFTLRLRIPYWSERTTAAVNGQPVTARPGSYLTLRRRWQPGDQVRLGLDLRPHFWVGERECAGKVSIYRGPLLLAYDPRFNDRPWEELPRLAATGWRERLRPWGAWPQPWLLLEVPVPEGRPVYLCDFASAGATGTPYRTWLNVEGATCLPFSRQQPLRSGRPA